MIRTYVLTIGQVQTLQPVDASLFRSTYDDDVLTKSSCENPVRESSQIDFATGNVFLHVWELEGGGGGGAFYTRTSLKF